MRTLYLLRHAEARATSSGRGDHARELTERGVAQAEQVGATLREAGVQLVLSSSATRTRQTAQHLGLGVPVLPSDEIYNAPAFAILAEINTIPDEVEVLLVVGHAPGIPALAHGLADEASDTEALQLIGHRFPTATLVRLDTEAAWSDLRIATLRAALLG